MNLNNFYKRYYYENGFEVSNIIRSVEFSKDILWLVYINPISINSMLDHQIDFTFMIKKKLPKDFLKNL